MVEELLKIIHEYIGYTGCASTTHRNTYSLKKELSAEPEIVLFKIHIY